MKTRLALSLLPALASVAAETSCPTILIPNTWYPPITGPGWQGQVVAAGLTKPRSLAFDSTGALLVVESGKGISRHQFTDLGGTCLMPNHSHMLVELPRLNHGLALSASGDTIYASTPDSVLSWPYDARRGRVTGRSRIIIANMSNSDLVTRTLLMSRSRPNILIVSRGGPEDNIALAEKVENGFNQIKAFDLDELKDRGTDATYDFVKDGTVLGWGLRNSVGVGEHPLTGGIWAVENSVDRVTRNGVAVHEYNPGDELNFLGYLNGTGTGKNFGYPNCFAVWYKDEIPENEGLDIGMQFAERETEELTDETCAEKYEPPRLTFPAHNSPMDIKFEGDGSAAYVSFRGSFEGGKGYGYEIVRVLFDTTTGEPVLPANSGEVISDIRPIFNLDLSKCPENCFRPVGMAWDSNGRLWFASDSTGEIYVLYKLPGRDRQFIVPEGYYGKDSASGKGVSWELLLGLGLGVAWFGLL